MAIHEYFRGDSFGESSLIFERPRSSTVICSSDTCSLHEMVGSDFLAVLDSHPDAAASLRDMCRKRLFKKAVKKLSLEKNRGLTNADIVAAFHEADLDGSGLLSFDEIKGLMHKMDPTIPEQEIRSLLKFVDIDEDGLISLGKLLVLNEYNMTILQPFRLFICDMFGPTRCQVDNEQSNLWGIRSFFCCGEFVHFSVLRYTASGLGCLDRICVRSALTMPKSLLNFSRRTCV